MLFDPTILVEEPLAVLAVVAVIIFGKSLAAFIIVLAFGHSVATALIVSASLAQIGEFSFILAGLGLSLGLLPSEGKDLILAGALLSITLNPFIFAGSDKLAAWIQRRPKLLRRRSPPLAVDSSRRFRRSTPATRSRWLSRAAGSFSCQGGMTG